VNVKGTKATNGTEILLHFEAPIQVTAVLLTASVLFSLSLEVRQICTLG